MWSGAAAKVLRRPRFGIGPALSVGGADRRDAFFDIVVGEVLAPCPAVSVRSRAPVMIRHTRHAAAASTSPLTLRQLLTEQGIGILGLILQPKLIFPDATPSPALQTEPELPAESGSASADRAERSAIHVEFRARMAAARICLPKNALAAAMRTLHRERRACLQALRDRIAARRAVRAHEHLARGFRRAAALTARGVLQRPLFEMPQDTDARVKAAILNKLGI